MGPQRGGSRRPKHEPLDAVVGLIVGASWGALSGFGLGLWVLSDSWRVVVATIVVSALAFAMLGYFKGNDFFRWVRDSAGSGSDD